MILVRRSGLVEENAVQMFNPYGFHLSSSFLIWSRKFLLIDSTEHKANHIPSCYHLLIIVPLLIQSCIFHQVLSGRETCASFLSTSSLSWQLVVHLPLRVVFYPKGKVERVLIHSPRWPLALDRERILIRGFIRSSPLAAYEVAHSLPLGGADRDFSLNWGWDFKVFLISHWYFHRVDYFMGWELTREFLICHMSNYQVTSN